MKLSIVIPAFNEQQHLPECLASVRQAVETLRADTALADFDAEVIVTDNNSTDSTAQLAREAGAQVVFEPINHIARARNAGAAVATGDWMLFIDADSQLHAETLRDTMRVIRSGHYVGGGCLVNLDHAPWWGWCFVAFWNAISRWCNWAAGSFLFCRSDAFRELGGFSPEYFAAEELEFSSRLKQWGRQRRLRFTILKAQPHLSSGRKFELYSTREIVLHVARSMLLFGRTVRNKRALDFYYDGRR